MKRILPVVVLTLVLVLVPVAVAVASPAPMPPFAVQRGQLYAPLAYQHPNDSFGGSVDVDGDVMAVGSPQDASNAGAVYAYRRVAGVWSDPVRIVPADLAAGDRYGRSVTVDGDRIIVGSPFHDTTITDAGAVYIWKWNTGTSTWTQETTHLTGASTNEQFGWDVALDNLYLAIGSPGNDFKASGAGAVFVYRYVSGSWLYNARLTDTNGGVSHSLGYSVDIDATNDLMIAAGAIQAGIEGWVNCGCVCTFEYSEMAWHHQDTLWAPSDRRADGSWFGYDVAISDRRIIVGAPMKGVAAGAMAGEAYTYVRALNLWQLEQTLYNPYPSEGDSFGISVACEGHAFLVGSWYEDGYVGAIYPYTSWYGNLTAWPKLSATGTGVTHFGTSVALSNGTIVGGAQMASSPDTGQCGGAYVFTSRGTITGTVRDADTGTLLPGMELSAYQIGAPDPGDSQIADLQFADGSGAYTLTLDTGTYIIVAMDPTDTFYYSFYNHAATYAAATQVTVNANGTVSGIDLYMYRKGAVYRFYNSKTGTHFYTPSVSERDNVIATLSYLYQYEGIAYVTDPVTDNVPLERFYNFKNGSHFYTADPVEAANVKLNLTSTYAYDGPTYGVSLSPSPGKRPVYRFYNLRNGSHFYTASETERATVETTLGDTYKPEGPAFWIDN